VKKLILAGALLLAVPGAQAQGTGPNPNSRPVRGYSTTGGTSDQHQQFNPTNTQVTAPAPPQVTRGAVGTRNPRN